MKQFKRAVVVVATFIMAVTAMAEVPQVINFQGYLTATDGTPYDGAKLLKFIIWDDPVASAPANEKWNSTFQSVTVTNGLFEIQLGAPPMPPLPDDLFSNDTTRFLGIQVDVDPELSPRTKMTSVAYAYQSLRSDSAGYAATSGYTSDADLLDGLNSTDFASVSDFTTHTGDASAHHTKTTDASELSAGILADARLSSNIPRLNVNNTFTSSFNSFYSDMRVHDNDLNLWRDNKNRWSLRESASKGFGIQQRYNNADVLVNITRMEIDDNGLVQINNSGGTGQLNVATSELYAGYFTSDLLSSSSRIVHAEYNGLNGNQDVIAVYGIAEPNDGYGLGGFFEGGFMGILGKVQSNYDGSTFGIYADCYNGSWGLAYGIFSTADNYGTGDAIGIWTSAGGSSTAYKYGIFAEAFGGGTKYAGYFSGNVTVTGTLSKAGGAFQIDHPLDPENKYLYHSFVESPDMMNVYNGNVTLDAVGEATIELPDYFETLNRDFRYQLTCIGGFAPVYIADKISGNRFRIAGGEPGMEVSWMVTGVRQDKWAEANRIQVEVDKPAREIGKYIHPEAYGLGEEMFIHYEQKKEAERAAERVAEKSER